MKKSAVPECHAFQNRPNWYLKDRSPVVEVTDKRTRKYFELEERTDSKGFRGEVLVEKEYPITPEFVSSFATGSDYRADPLGAVASAPYRRNLGDITAVQEALGLDFDTARHVYVEYLRAMEAKKASSAAPAAAPSEGENNG